MADFDPGPPAALARHFAALPSYTPHRDLFWYDWGPVFYRGRLNGSAKLLGIASDPGPTERIACRTLVGDAGQRVQGFLTKLGLTHDYVLVNAFAYALHPSSANSATPMLAEPAHLTWRNKLLDAVTGSNLQAIVAFGAQAQRAAQLWTSRPDVPLIDVPHPSSRSAPVLAAKWKAAITDLRGIVTPDPDGDATGANYGAGIVEADYARIPARDLPFGLPGWFGDDAWGRQGTPRHNNSVERPSSDSEHVLSWQAPHGTA
ncbi:MAG: uracil-DNA glycosylase family protein [Mycobacteriales bacterium]